MYRNSQTIAEYVYDYNGMRMVKRNFTSGTQVNTVTSWSDSFETKAIVGGSTTNTSYYFVNGQLIAKKDNSGTKTYFHNDHLGSTSLVTTQAGTVLEATTYDPWGEVLSGGTASKFLYTGQEKDSETGLHYYNARYYNSNIRRFIQPDQIVSDIYNPQMLNRYSYVGNNPLRYTDPSGHNIIDWVKGLFGNAQQTSSLSSKTIEQSLAKNTPISGLGGSSGKSSSSSLSVVTAGASQPFTTDRSREQAVVSAVYNLAIGDDINTLRNPNAGLGSKTWAVAGLASYLGGPELKVGGKILTKTRELFGGAAKTIDILGGAEKWLGPGYKEIGKKSSGVYRSADDLRQFRIDEGSLMDLRQGPHVSFESVADDGRTIIENTHVSILDP